MNNPFRRNYITYTLALLVVVIAGYFPVAFQLNALKNDILQLDLPVKFFISQRLHQGEFPSWFYSWGAGFPLGHIFTWSIYNPVTLLFTSAFTYDVHTLHLEFIFYLWMGATGFFVLAHKFIRVSGEIAFLLASAYVLSGITMSCGQFMAYIAAIGILPWVYAAFGLLLRSPTITRSVFFACIFFVMCSWTYPAGIIICAYTLVGWFCAWLYIQRKNPLLPRNFYSLSISIVVFLLLAAPLIYSTVVIWPHLPRSNQAMTASDLDFGFLHPFALLSAVLPLAGSALRDLPLELLFQNIFFGVVMLLVAVAAFLIKDFRSRYPAARLLLILACLFLMFSFGSSFLLKPLVDRFLPGFNRFRFPSYFRLFFLIAILLAAGHALEYARSTLAVNERLRRLMRICAFSALILSGFVFWFVYQGAAHSLVDKLLVVELAVVVLSMLLVAGRAAFRWKPLSVLLMADMMLHAWIMLPVYVISSYPIWRVHQINNIHKAPAAKVQVNNAQGAFMDSAGHLWNGRNVYVNEVSAADQYRGPLWLSSYNRLKEQLPAQPEHGDMIFWRKGVDGASVTMENDTFEGNRFSARVNNGQPADLSLFQLNYPGWKAFADRKELVISDAGDGLITVTIPVATRSVEFIYKDPWLDRLTWVYLITLVAVLGFFCVQLFRKRALLTRPIRP